MFLRSFSSFTFAQTADVPTVVAPQHADDEHNDDSKQAAESHQSTDHGDHVSDVIDGYVAQASEVAGAPNAEPSAAEHGNDAAPPAQAVAFEPFAADEEIEIDEDMLQTLTAQPLVHDDFVPAPLYECVHDDDGR